MNLPPHQVERFYRIWFPLLHYVNKQLHLTTTFPDHPRPGAISNADAMLIRNALWENDGVRESFIVTNPAGLTPDDLALVASWQYRVAGAFFIVRHLKKYSVFLSEGPEAKAHAYGVLGLVSPLVDIVGSVVPLYTKAVLLPFEDKIIYDSLLEPFAVSFVQTYLSAAGEKANPTSFKRFVRFLADSGRMDYDRVEALRDYVKSVAE